MTGGKQDIDEAVSVVAWDRRWPQLFERERERLRAVLPASVQIEHFGSTAVPGLAAKPVVDILVGTSEADELGTVAELVEGLGYRNLGEAGVAGRLYLRRRQAAAYNISVTVLDGQLWSDNLAVRDFLRHSESARRRYAEAKATAVREGHRTLLAYSDAKARVVGELVAEARAWRTGG